MISIVHIKDNADIEKAVRDHLHAHGHPHPNMHERGALIGRAFNANNIERILSTGTDGKYSVCSPQQSDALKEEGLGPQDIFYADRLGLVIKYVLPYIKSPSALSIYDPSKLELAIPLSKREVGLDDMYKAKPPYSFQDALLAVFVFD